jgi:hypothetical protein
MRTPAAPPPTQRTLKAVAPEPEEQVGDPTGEPEATEGSVPADMNKLFQNLMAG